MPGLIIRKQPLQLLSGKWFTTLSILVLLILSQCAPKTPQSELDLETPESFSAMGEEEMPDRWWTSFDNPELNTLVDSTLSNNYNIKGVWQQLVAARAIYKRESSSLLPDFETNIQSALQRPQPDFVGGENVQLGISASYEVDLWGRISSQVEAEKFRSEASYLDYQSAAISLSAEIVRTWYRLMAANRQRNIVQQQIETNQQMLNVLESRFGTGQITRADILRQERLLESSRNQKISAETQIQTLENQLAVLLGNPPQEAINYNADSLPELPSLPQTGVPSELVQRRPDVQSAYKRLKAADKELATAISSKYPRLSISSNTSIRSNNFQDLLEGWAFSIGGNLAQPLFYGGRLNAEVDRATAFKQQRAYEYGQTVLTAFREVENTLTQEQQQKKRISTLENQLNLANQTYQQLQTQYFNGMVNYLDVLTALTEKQQLQRDLVQAKLSLIEFRIALYRALAGGFETEREVNN